MSYIITQEDIDLAIQPCKVEMKLEIYDSNNKLVDILKGLISNGTNNLNADSRIRRTYSPTIVPTDEQSIRLAKNPNYLLDKTFKLFIGLTRLTGGDTKWYPQGVYILTGSNNSYDAVTNQLQITCSDKMVNLDGTVNGEIFGALTLELPAYTEIFRKSWITSGTYSSFDEAYLSHHKDNIVLMNESVKALVKTIIEQYSSLSEDERNTYLTNLQNTCDAVSRVYKVDYGLVESSDEVLILGHNVIKAAIKSLLANYTNITDFIIEDIGNYNGTIYSEGYETYREENKYWDCIPYTQEFSSGSNVCAALETLCTIYPNYDFSFDENGTLVIRMIPTLEDEDVILTYKQLQQILVADDTENSTVDLTTIRNVCEVWGQNFEADFYTEKCATSGTVYNATVDNYGTSYKDGDMISIKFDTTSVSGMQLKINSLSAVSIYKEYSDELIDVGAIQANNTYTLKYKKIYKNGVTTNKFYLLGQYQVHGLCVLTESENDPIYTKEYFQKKYNCNNVLFEIIPDSPYTIQKIGERVKSYSGDTYESISSDSGAIEQASYELWKNCRLTDNVTIKTVLFPCISEYQKISYVKANTDTIKQYITHNITHNFDDNTTTIEMYTFYPLKKTQ